MIEIIKKNFCWILSFLLFASLLFLIADRKSNKETIKKITKSNRILNKYMEATPFVFNGKLFYLLNERIDKPLFLQLSIFDFKTNEKIASFGKGFGLASAYAENNVLYIFATKNWFEFGKSEIYLIKTTDLKNFSAPRLIYKANDNQKLFNTSVTKNTENGKYTLVVEADEIGLVHFSFIFLESNDLVNWTIIKNNYFAKETYVASPAIRFIDGYYYLLYLVQRFQDPNCTACRTFITNIARSKNLRKWEISFIPVLAPDLKNEGINNSDVDLTEFNNKVYIFYAVGDQTTWAGMKYASYDGPLTEFVRNFF